MRRPAYVHFVLLSLLASCTAAAETGAPKGGSAATTPQKINWQRGPSVARIGTHATISLPKGYLFADRVNAKIFLELTENIPDGDELGILTSEDEDWFVIYRFDEIGYVKDDDKKQLDADALLNSIREGTEKANTERKARGWETMEVVGWQEPPRYEEKTNNLVWAIKGRSSDGEVINYNSRVLGRQGVMKVSLVSDVPNLNANVAAYKTVASGFTYNPDSRYSAWMPGDKVAEYGLTALIVGGAAAAASKTGLLKAFWKLGVVALLGLGTLVKKLFTRATPSAPESTTPQSS